jgi:hypothetical protein
MFTSDNIPWYVVHVWDEKAAPADYVPVFESKVQSTAMRRARSEENDGYQVRVFQVDRVNFSQPRVFEHPRIRHARATQFIRQYRNRHDEEPPSRILRNVLKVKR